jgi:RimJ/RimL family protein N-acetyltransferase
MDIQFRDFNGAEDWEWINQQVGINQAGDTTGIMAVDLGSKETVGACVMDNWTQNSVQCHFMITSPLVLKHDFLDCCFNFMFNVAGVTRVYGLVPANNLKAVKFNTHMGFTVKARLDEAYEVGVDYLLMEMKRENCTYLQLDKAA